MNEQIIKNERTTLYVTIYRKTRHNAAHFEKIFFCTYRVVGVQILSSPSFIVVA